MVAVCLVGGGVCDVVRGATSKAEDDQHPHVVEDRGERVGRDVWAATTPKVVTLVNVDRVTGIARVPELCLGQAYLPVPASSLQPTPAQASSRLTWWRRCALACASRRVRRRPGSCPRRRT